MTTEQRKAEAEGTVQVSLTFGEASLLWREMREIADSLPTNSEYGSRCAALAAKIGAAHLDARSR